MARQTGNQLAEQGQTRRAEFAAMIRSLRGTIRRQADQTRGQLAELAADLRHGGEVFAGRPVRQAGFPQSLNERYDLGRMRGNALRGVPWRGRYRGTPRRAFPTVQRCSLRIPAR